jgi:hypothetical protein
MKNTRYAPRSSQRMVRFSPRVAIAAVFSSTVMASDF